MKGYRTIIASFLTILFGFLAQTDWVTVLNDPKSGGVAIFLGILMAVCRFVSSTPVFQSQPAPKQLEPVEPTKQ
jgi:hypothetical protein